MSRLRRTLAFALIMAALALAASAAPQLLSSGSAFPLYFEPNVGQAAPQVQFIARGAGYTMFVTDRDAVAVLKGAVLRMQLVGTGAHPAGVGVDPLPGRSNYFIGNDPQQWHTDVPHYSAVRITDVYRGVDLVYRGAERMIEYDFVVKPGGDPRAIDLHFEGADRLDIDDHTGDLVIGIAGRELRQSAPVVYQEIGGVRRNIEGGYLRRSDRDVTFRVDRYDAALPLVIDPSLLIWTYLGGSGEEQGAGVVTDRADNVYLVGTTASTDFPVVGGVKPTNPDADYDAFVVKLNTSGGLVYATYLGGTNGGADHGYGIAIDGDGNAYVAGETISSTLPVTSTAFQKVPGGTIDGFIAKLNPSGNAVLYATYAGGNGDDYAEAIAVDSQQNMYVTGRTKSSNFPGPGGTVAPNRGGGQDVFVMKIAANGSLANSTYLGGSDADEGRAIALDSLGNVYVAGETIRQTSSGPTNFPVTPDALPPLVLPDGATSAFLTKYDTSFTRVYSTLFYNGELTSAYALATYPPLPNLIAIAGQARNAVPFCASCLPYQGSRGFVSMFAPPNQTFLFSASVGSPIGMPDDPGPQDKATGVALDEAAYVYVTGETNSDILQTINPVQAHNAGRVDAFVQKLRMPATTGAQPTTIYLTYLGGSLDELLPTVAVDSSGNAWIAGTTFSDTFWHVTGRPFAGGGSDAFAAKIGPAPGTLLPPPTFTASGRASDALLAWTSVPGATLYIFERATVLNGVWSFANMVSDSFAGRTLLDTRVTSFTAYEYRARTVSDEGIGVAGQADLACVFPTLDDPAVAGSSIIRARHVSDVRLAVDAIRSFAGMGAYGSYSNAIAPGSIIRASDFSQTQTALNQALQALDFTTVVRSYGGTVKAFDINDLRARTRH